MWQSILIYAPPVVMLLIAARLTPFGRLVVGNWDARQLLVTIAFFWMGAAIVWRVIRSTTTDSAIDTSEARVSKETESINEPQSSGPIQLEYASTRAKPNTPSDGRAAGATLCILLGVVISGMGLAVLIASSGPVDPDFGRSFVVILIGAVLCAVGMSLKRPPR